MKALALVTTLLLSGIISDASEEKLAPPQLPSNSLGFRFALAKGHLQPLSMLPLDLKAELSAKRQASATVTEVALQVTGQNWNDHHAQKLIGGNPGAALIYTGQRNESTSKGQHTVLLLKSLDPALEVESHYLFVQNLPVVRRWTRVINRGQAPVGIEHVSSAMLYNFADFGQLPLENKLRIYHASNSWRTEAQWQCDPPSKLGFSDNGEFNLNAISFSNLGSWSTMSHLPMAMAENRELGVTWFWQIEHNGSWHWEISNTGNGASYLYLGGPDELHSQAWKQLQPGASYETVPVAIGCVKGSFNEALAKLTVYRRAACLQPHADNRNCPVIFNDYMNCLAGNPTTEKELPLIDAAAAAGCEYFVIDAGWYAEMKESWWESVGLWHPSKTRWTNGGLKQVLDRIRSRGMVPGLWLEIEVAGIHSPLKDKPDSWFFRRHGQRVIDHGRYLLDFRNAEVRAHADSVIDRIVKEYGAGYIKVDYNVDALMGTETGAESFGQGLLEHQRAYLQWIDAVHARFPELVIENCGSGGGRMDYAMLSHHQLQSSSDQTDYRKYASIVAGGLAAVLPEQFAVWSYPKRDGGADEASFNMVNAMLGRIHQSGHLAELKEESRKQVHQGLRIYKQRIRSHLPQMTPFYPSGFAAMSDETSPVVAGLRDSERQFISVWRLAGSDTVTVPLAAKQVELLYPADLGISMTQAANQIVVKFPRTYMAVLLEVHP